MGTVDAEFECFEQGVHRAWMDFNRGVPHDTNPYCGIDGYHVHEMGWHQGWLDAQKEGGLKDHHGNLETITDEEYKTWVNDGL